MEQGLNQSDTYILGSQFTHRDEFTLGPNSNGISKQNSDNIMDHGHQNSQFTQRNSWSNWMQNSDFNGIGAMTFRTHNKWKRLMGSYEEPPIGGPSNTIDQGIWNQNSDNSMNVQYNQNTAYNCAPHFPQGRMPTPGLNSENTFESYNTFEHGRLGRSLEELPVIGPSNTIHHGNQEVTYNGSLPFPQRAFSNWRPTPSLSGIGAHTHETNQDTGDYGSLFKTSEHYQNQGSFVPQNTWETDSWLYYNQQGLTIGPHPLHQNAMYHPAMSEPFAHAMSQPFAQAMNHPVWSQPASEAMNHPIMSQSAAQQAMNFPTFSQPSAQTMNHPALSQPAPQGINHLPVSQPAAEPQRVVLKLSKNGHIQWTPELHGLFQAAVQELGGFLSATPYEILKKMNVSGVTIAHVKSHLQKFRIKSSRPSIANQGNQVSEGESLSNSTPTTAFSGTSTQTLETQAAGEDESLIRSSETPNYFQNLMTAPYDSLDFDDFN